MFNISKGDWNKVAYVGVLVVDGNSDMSFRHITLHYMGKWSNSSKIKLCNCLGQEWEKPVRFNVLGIGSNSDFTAYKVENSPFMQLHCASGVPHITIKAPKGKAVESPCVLSGDTYRPFRKPIKKCGYLALFGYRNEVLYCAYF